MNFAKYILLLVTVAVVSVAQLILKKGVVVTPAKGDLLSLAHTFFSPIILAGFFFYVISAILGIYLLQKFPLSVAIPSMSLSYVVILFSSAYFFDEKITAIKVAGIICILVGVVLLSRSNS